MKVPDKSVIIIIELSQRVTLSKSWHCIGIALWHIESEARS